MKNKHKIISISIDEALFVELEIYKEKTMISRSKILAEAIKKYLEMKKNERN